jgi:hypothetical protein
MELLVLAAIAIWAMMNRAAYGPPWPKWPTSGNPPTPGTPPVPGTPPSPGDWGKVKPLPGSGWTPYVPTPGWVVERASALLRTLPFGEYSVEDDPAGGKVAFRKEPHPGGKIGITAWHKAP